ncbi:MAG: BrnT family toxin [Rhodospirillaceae bacterium]
MSITFDAAKNAQNIAARGIPFEMAERFKWDKALVVKDDRADFGEYRYQALGLIEGRLHMLVFTPRDGGIRVISLRKANEREVARYESLPN